ncbi:MAG: SDR family NAD(P)-dependent oxidoreductase [Candidatus Omnitrophica bacterium]|nr:SDR family NAD(P)-dependent oxidoreductase [Candidatus Omnitrophota bacterium]MCB9719471.1 SDR family NAD(P)-dependent oxidoreductase [Candidatus Omnitrophota bacterium]
MTTRRFTLADQLAFAGLSGDNNPLHVDAVAARRLLFGAPVVHGIHTLLWALECGLTDTDAPLIIRSLKAVFSRPVRVGSEVGLRTTIIGEHQARMEIMTADGPATTIDFSWESGPPPQSIAITDARPVQHPPDDLGEQDIAGKSGALDLRLPRADAARMFPRLTSLLSAADLATLLATTRLVGVECPGLHSVYSELWLNAVEGESESVLRYNVTRCERRMVWMDVIAPRFTGGIRSLVRPTFRGQGSYALHKESVDSTEFRGQRALIVGGSRGLGETAAKFLAAGGAEVRITYTRGRDDAEQIVTDITGGGGTAASLPLDVTAPPDGLTDGLNGWQPTHLYYFATPYIAAGSRGRFSAEVFDRFCRFYVTGFQSLVEILVPGGLRGVYYPSTVFVEELPADMAEYATAKQAGETLCAILAKTHRDLTIHCPRLPKLTTDQTQSIIPTRTAAAGPVILEHLRQLRDATRT